MCKLVPVFPSTLMRPNSLSLFMLGLEVFLDLCCPRWQVFLHCPARRLITHYWLSRGNTDLILMPWNVSFFIVLWKISFKEWNHFYSDQLGNSSVQVSSLRAGPFVCCKKIFLFLHSLTHSRYLSYIYGMNKWSFSFLSWFTLISNILPNTPSFQGT